MNLGKITIYYTTCCSVMLCCNALYCIMLCCAILVYAVFYCTMFVYTTLHFIMFCGVISYHRSICFYHVLACYTVLYSAMLYITELYDIEKWYVISYDWFVLNCV